MSAVTLEIEPLGGTFGAIVRGAPLASLDPDTWCEIHSAFIEYALLIFPGQSIDREQQNAFARRFGDLEFPAAPISNLDADGQIHYEDDDDLVKSLRGNEGWHHDSTYMPLQAKGAVFRAEIVPDEGGATGFADMRAAYEALDADTRAQIGALSAYHSLYYSQRRAGYLPKKNAHGRYDMYGYHRKAPSLRPLVKVHPDTGRPNLLVGRHAYGVVAHAHALRGHVEWSPEASERLLDRLVVEACTGDRVHYHTWRVGDVAVWDNRRLMHRATPFDMQQPRRMWHARVAGDPRTEMASNHAPT